MAYKALYRTYRPSTFDEVAGQQHIVKTLKNALSTGKIAHAYLFAGPRGTGKTTMAKIFAKALNCEHGIGEQCNECKNCLAVNDGSHPDVLELDAASNNGVDEIRELIDRVKYGTILGRYKVYIIDEVHMLSAGAFNALLKTLEEPPEHVIFILATTEPHKILPTILSRCQRYDFNKLTETEIKERIRVVLNHEHIDFNDKAVDLIVSLADGGMRDALSILDQVLAYSGNSLNEEDILNIFSLESTDEKIHLIESIINHDVADVLARINKYFNKGSDIKRLTNDLLNILKDTLIFDTSSRSDFLETISKEDARYIANLIPQKELLSMIDILMSALKDYKSVNDINPLFEITLLKMASIESNETVKIQTQKVEQKPVDVQIEKPVVKQVEKPIPEPVVRPEPEPVLETPTAVKISENIIYLKEAEQEESFKMSDDLLIKVMVTSKKETKADIKDNWDQIKRYVAHPSLGNAAAMLIDAHPLVASNKVLLLETPLNKMADNINLKINQAELQSVVETVFNKKMFIYAVPHLESVRLQQKYMGMMQVGKLPKAKEVSLEFIGE